MDKIQELKAKAYDIIAQIQFLQTELQKVNQMIAEENNKKENVNHSDGKERKV